MSDIKDENKKKKVSLGFAEDTSEAQKIQDEYNSSVLSKSAAPNFIIADLIKHAQGSTASKKKAPRLSFSENPIEKDHFAGIFKFKRGLLPNNVIKKIRVQNLLVAAIVRTRGNQISMFGNLKKSRFDIGFEINLKKEFRDVVEPEELVKIKDRISQTTKMLMDCGKIEGLRENEKTSFSEYLKVQTMNMVSFGYHATEVIYEEGEEVQHDKLGHPVKLKKFHRFRAADSGTIYRSVKKGEAATGVRNASAHWIEQQQGIKINRKDFEKDEYSWIQVIEGMPRQAFSDDEMIVCMGYPSTDVEHNGYPVSPLDTVINAVTTHSSIEIYNKLYFQNGKSAKGMVVIRSDDIDENSINDITQQFQASINNVNNSFRIPIFGIGKDDNVEWISTMPAKKDGEFEYLFDQTTRNILSAFNMAPDELPGFAHLSRGAAQQSLSEASNEYKLTAQRDGGLRPLMLQFQDFINEKLFPIIDPELSQICDITFSGLDAETREKETNRLQMEMPIHMNYDDVMDDVDKDPLGSHLGGEVPFNERLQAVQNNYIRMNILAGNQLDHPALFLDPLYNFIQNPAYQAHLQMLAQANPSEFKAIFATRKNLVEQLKELVEEFLEENES